MEVRVHARQVARRQADGRDRRLAAALLVLALVLSSACASSRPADRCIALAQGSWERVTGSERDDASLEIRCDGDGMQVSGTALWGVGDESRPPHTGTLAFTAPLSRNGTSWVDGGYRITLLFRDDRLYVEEDNALGYHGMNVTFAGEYARTARH